MNVFVYLDESGSIHKNSRTKYFAVGGYFCLVEDRNKVISTYRRNNKIIKNNRHFDLEKEIKSFDMNEEEKKKILMDIQNIKTFCGCAKIFDKLSMKKDITQSNIFFNYAVKLLVHDCILPVLEFDLYKDICFVLSVDNRNVRVGDLKNLENYLKTEFCVYEFDFQVTYYDSRTNYGIQLADLIVNTFYNFYKDVTIVKNVILSLDFKNFRISLFPGGKCKGRISKIVV